MPAVSLSPFGGVVNQFFDNNGDPLAGGKIYTYAAGTTTPQTTYTSSSGATPHTNPIILDSAGRVATGEVWLVDNLEYKFILQTSTGIQIGSYDNVTGINSGVDAQEVSYIPPYTSSVATNVESKLAQYVSVKDFGAVGDNVTDDTAAIQAAVSAASFVFVPPGTYRVNGLTLSGNLTLFGAGKEVSILNVVTTAPTYGISITGQRNAFKNLTIQGANANLIQTTGGSYYSDFENVRFGTCNIALRVTVDFFWSRFINCVWRECDQGVLCTALQVMNAVQFIGCSTFKATPVAGEYAIEIHGSDGISFIGCDIQNQGVYLNGCGNTTISGGYWEAYTVPALKLVSGSTDVQGIFAPSATIFDIDDDAAKGMTGFGIPNNIFYPLRPTFTQSINLFPDPSASTPLAVSALGFSPTGVNFTGSINGSGNVELTSTNILARSGFSIPAATSEAISVYIRWRATAGAAKVQLSNTVSNSQVISTAGDPFIVTRLQSRSSAGAAPALVIGPEGAGPTWTVEISDVYVAAGDGMFASPASGIKSLGQAAEQSFGVSLRNANFASTVAASTGTVDVTLGSFTGLLIVKNALKTNADNVFTSAMYFVQITFVNNFYSTLLASDDGPTGGCTLTVTSPSNSVVRLTNTHAADTQMTYQFIGLNV